MRKALFLAILVMCSVQAVAQKWVRVNTVGYLPNDLKVAVFISVEPAEEASFNVCDAVTGKVVYTGSTKSEGGVGCVSVMERKGVSTNHYLP